MTIDSFLITLGLDPSGLKHGSNEAKKELEELKHKAGEVGEAFAGMLSALGELAAGALVLHEAFKIKDELVEFVHRTVEADVTTGRLAKALNLSVEAVGAWQGATKLAGGTADGFNQSVKGLAGSLVDIEKGLPRAKRALTIFQAAGITGLGKGKHEDVLDVMSRLSEKMSGMNALEAGRLGSRLGLDEGTIRLLRKGHDGVQELKDEAIALGIATTEDAKAAEEFHHAQIKLDMSSEAVGRKFRELILPVMQVFADIILNISKWAHEHSEFIKAAFIGIAAGMTAVAVATTLVGYAALAAHPAMMQLAVDTLAATWPLVLIGLAVVALIGGIAYLVIKYREWSAEGSKAEGIMGHLFSGIQQSMKDAKALAEDLFYAIWDPLQSYIDVFVDQFELLFALMTGDPDKISAAWAKVTDDIEWMFIRLFRNLRWMWREYIHNLTHDEAMHGDRGIGENMVRKTANILVETNPFLAPAYVLGGRGLMDMWAGKMFGTEERRGAPGESGALDWSKGVPAQLGATSGASVTHTSSIGTIQIFTQATDGQGIWNDLTSRFPSLIPQSEVVG